jgi:hypothetical protein
MMFYLTGASSSLAKSQEAPQPDTAKSLGGYVSSSLVPNGELNVLFDLISTYTINKHRDEYVAIGLVNKYDKTMRNLRLSVIAGPDDICRFDVAAVTLDSNFAMEQIPNRYAQPINAEFHNVDFVRAYVDLNILQPASPNEDIMLYPFNVLVETGEDCRDINDTYRYFKMAFEYNDEYAVSRVSETVFRITRQNNTIMNQECRYLASGGFNAQFKSNIKNGVTKSVTLIQELKSGDGIGLWIRRRLNTYKFVSNEQLVRQYLEKYIPSQVEQVELFVSFSENGHNSFNNSFNESFD